MAAALGVAPTHFVTCYQIHSPDVVVADEPWTRENAPRADAIVTRVPGLAIGVATADCGPVLFADARGRRDRRRACRLEGRAHRRARGDGRGDGKARRRARAHRRRARPDDPPAELRGRRRIRRPLHGGGRRRTRASSRRRRATATRCSICPATSRRGSNAPSIKSVEDLGLCTYADPARFFSYRRTTHRGEPDYGRHVNAIALMPISAAGPCRARLALPKRCRRRRSEPWRHDRPRRMGWCQGDQGTSRAHARALSRRGVVAALLAALRRPAPRPPRRTSRSPRGSFRPDHRIRVRSTARRSACSTAWSTTSPPRRSRAMSRSRRARAPRTIACAAISPRR